MNSKYIKYALLKYFRFNRQMICGTEVHVYGGIADVLVITENKSKSIEIEIKISKSDFKREFKDKHLKHSLINTYIKCPNYYYFAFPHELAKDLIDQVPGHYGVIEIYNHNEVNIIRQGKRLNQVDNEILYMLLVKRLNSELIKYYERCEIEH